MLNDLLRLMSRAIALLRSRSLDRDFDQELMSHAEALEEDYRRQGMTAEQARREARLRLGGLARLKEEHRAERGLPLVEASTDDLRYAVRALRKSPGFTAAAVLVLGIGIGANTAMFSVVHGVLLRPLDLPEPDRLVSLARGSAGGTEPRWISLRRVESMRMTESFTGVGAFLPAGDRVVLSGDGGPEVLRASRVSANFLEILGVPPMLGRSFLPAEDAVGARTVALVSADLWRRRFAADSAIAGRVVMMNSVPYTIVGVLPAGFQFPLSDVDVWLPQPAVMATVPAQYHPCCSPLIGFARLKPGVSVEQARAELAVLSDRYAAANPNARRLDAGLLGLTPWKEEITARVSTMVWLLAGAVIFVLLIGCVNVATLVLARVMSRSNELAVRAALGAGRSRLVRQLVTEGLVLASAGGVLGLVLALGALRAIAAMTLVDLPRVEDIRLSGIVLAFCALLSIGTGVVFGLFPALQTVRHDLMGRLRQGGAAATALRGRQRPGRVSARGTLVIVQVALSIVLLVGAGLMMQTLFRLARVELGFEPAGLLTTRVALAPARYDTPEKRAIVFEELVRRVEAVPGVAAVALVRSLPRTPVLGTNIQIVGSEIPEPGHVGLMLQVVSPGAFRVLGVPLRSGREFVPRDNVTGAPPVAIVNESFARRVWPGYPDTPDPIGQQLRVPILDNLGLEIVGVVADVRQGGPEGDAPAQFYMPVVSDPPPTAYLAIRSTGDPMALVDSLRAEVLTIDPELPLADVRMMEDRIEAGVGQQHVAARLLGLFAGAALLLVVVGIYGLLAYTVIQRQQEIGIRRAFGARRFDVLALVLKQALVLTVIGMTFGFMAATALGGLMEGLLVGVSSTHAGTFAGVGLLFLIVTAVATLVPAWRAVRIEPVTALRV